VISWLKFHNISVRTHLESMNTSVIRKELREKKLRIPTKNYNILNPEKSYILGVLCGDGHINSKFIRFEIKKDEEFIKEFAKCLETVYGLKFNYRYYKPRNSFVLYASVEIICGDLLKYSNFGVRVWRVPREIMRSGDWRIISSFLRGFYDSEGCVARSSIISASICEKGLKEISILLRKLEIESKLCPIDNGKNKFYK